jgi:Glycosyltransferase family 87
MTMSNAQLDAAPGQSYRASYYVQALAMGLPAITFGLTLHSWLDEKRLVQSGGADFRLFYTGACMVRTGHSNELYSYTALKHFEDLLVSVHPLPLPFNHPPYEALLLVPFTYLRFQLAFLAWLGVNLVLLALCVWFLKPDLERLKPLWRWLPVAMFIGFIPFSVALMQGQDSILLLFLLSLAYLGVRRENEWLAGLLVGLCVFRFQVALPIAALFVLWRRWRFTAGFALSSLLCLFCSLWIVGIKGLMAYAGLLNGMSAGLDRQGEVLYGIPPAFMGNLRGMIYVVCSAWMSPASTHWLVIALSAALLLAVGFIARHQEIHSQLIAAVVTASLVSYHALSHDLSILLLPLVVLLAQHRSDDRWLAVIALVFTAPALDMIYRPLMFLACLANILLLGVMMNSVKGARSPST